MFEDRFSEMLRQYPESVSDKKKFVGLLKDFFPSQPMQVNLIDTTYELGIAGEIAGTPHISNTFAFRFVKRLVDEYGVSRINDQQYNAELLARDLAISRASLYKKIQNILGITPTDFIRNVRLKQAAQMLAESQLSITEIADSVGFATPRNFSASFKKMFGVLPSEYRTGKASSKE